MNIYLLNLLNIDSLETPIPFLGEGDSTNLTKGERIAFLIVGLLIIFLAAWLIWKYFESKSTKQDLKASVQDKSPWSFKGYWGRYRSETIIFLAFTCLIIGALLLWGAIGGTFVISSS